MEAALHNMYGNLISENFLTFIDVSNFLQNTCPCNVLEKKEDFLQSYRGEISNKRGYVWLDCPHFKNAFEMVFKHGCFIYKLKVQSFFEADNLTNLSLVCKTAKESGFVAFIEENFVVFPVEQRHFNETTKQLFLEFSALQPIRCHECEKVVKNERGLKRHHKLYHSLQRVKVDKQI
jgi:hypothetical protein